MKTRNPARLLIVCMAVTLTAACEPVWLSPDGAASTFDAEFEERGPNGGRILRDGEFAIELAIHEAGVPPEFRAWVSDADRPLPPDAVDLVVQLTRLGGRVDEFQFRPVGEFLRGDGIVDEPHSFEVRVDATHAGRSYRWEYDSFEGRTRIEPEIAREVGIATEIAGPAVIEETATLYGRVVADPERVSEVVARFDGPVRAVMASVGDRVRAGEVLATVESNESLQTFQVVAPIDGVIVARSANVGEQTRGRALFTIVDSSRVWVDLAVFPRDRARVVAGMPVRIALAAGGPQREGRIARIEPLAGADQNVTARVALENPDGLLAPGLFVRAEVEVARHEVPLAVRRIALQSFRDFTVVYAQVGDEYEVRMLELGREDGERAEVLDGLEPGTRYVTDGSYVIKADIEKSGAVHDH